MEAAIAGDGGSIADLGEWGVIAALRARMPTGPLTAVGIGDDSAVVRTPSGSVVAAVDLLLEGRHFRREWSSGYDIGIRAAGRSLSDVAAMGAVSTALLVALAAPGTLPAGWAADLADGLAAEAARAGAGVVGGDTAQADLVTLSVTALGDLQGRRPVLRSGARPGDVIAVAGTPGRSAAGLALLKAGVAAHPELLAAHLRPSPPYDAGPEAAILGATAMIDVSDGLLADVGHVAVASGAWIEIASSALDARPLTAAAASVLAASAAPAAGQKTGDALNGDAAALALAWTLTGGEDHSLVATFPPAVALPSRWHIIGEVRPGTGVTVDGKRYEGTVGWEHFA